MAFVNRKDAERVLDVLPKRFGKYCLTLHPNKTRLVPFHRPDRDDASNDRPGSFDLLGFTHHWGLSRKGKWLRMWARRDARRTLVSMMITVRTTCGRVAAGVEAWVLQYASIAVVVSLSATVWIVAGCGQASPRPEKAAGRVMQAVTGDAGTADANLDASIVPDGGVANCGVTLAASLVFQGSQRIDGSATLAQAMPFLVPSSIPITAGGTKNGQAQLQFSRGGGAQVTCGYDAHGGGSVFSLTSCSDGAGAATVESADTFMLHIQTADHGAETSASQIELSATLNAPDGTACLGTTKCNQTYACATGACVGSNPVACVASDSCHQAGTCDPSSGACSNPLKSDLSSCTISSQIGSGGGQVTHPEGIGVTVPAGALPDGTSVSVGSISTSSASLPTLPAGFAVLGMVSLSFSTEPTQPVEIFLPAPSAATAAGFFVAKVLEFGSVTELAIVDSASLSGNELVSNCPPFRGIADSGTYAMVGVPSGTSLALFRTLDTAGAAISNAFVTLTGAVAGFIGLGPVATVPMPPGETGTGSVAVAVGSGATSADAGTASDAGEPCLQIEATTSPPPDLVPVPIPTLTDLIAEKIKDIVLEEQCVDPNQIPSAGEPCDLKIEVQPLSMPQPPPDLPFRQGDSRKVTVTCDSTPCTQGTQPATFASMVNNGYSLYVTAYRTLGSATNPMAAILDASQPPGPAPSPVTVTKAGLVTAITSGDGTVEVAVGKTCLRKQSGPVGVSIIPQLAVPQRQDIPVTVSPGVFTFEEVGTGPDLIYGSHDPQGFSPYVRSGFTIDVVPTGSINGTLHWHETDSISNPKVPARPVAQRGVLWRDSIAGQDPLVFVRTAPGSTFVLGSLVAAASFADGSATTAIQLSGFLGGSPVATVQLAVSESYASYTGTILGGLQGAIIDRLEVIGLSGTAASYYVLDDVALNLNASR